MNTTIDNFTGKYRFLSNFYDGDPTLAERLWGYPTTEHYYQAMKSTDKGFRGLIKVRTAGQAKRLGSSSGMRSVGVVLRDDWEEIKDQVMFTGLMRKFAPGTELAQLLLDTENAYLKEGNHWHDNYWGSCSCVKCGNTGNNHLGILLMEVRDELREEG